MNIQTIAETAWHHEGDFEFMQNLVAEIFYNHQHFVLELKINRDSYTKEEGIEQLSAYLDKAGLKHGYLVVFEPRNTKKKTWEERINWYTEKYPFGNSEKEITFVEM